MIPTDAVGFFLSPVGLLLTYLWTFASLTAVQLTVRLIMRFNTRETALAALWLTLAAAAVGLAFVFVTAPAVSAADVERLRQQGQAAGVGDQLAQLYVVQQRLVWAPLALLPLGAACWGVVRHVLHVRQRSALLAAAALAFLLLPWPALVLA
jgi:BarA-like signal transduction histidine kinase